MRSRASSSAASAVARAGFERRGDLLRRYLKSHPVEIEPIEFLRVFFDRAVAAGGDVGDDGADRRFDVGRRFALGVEKRAKVLRKIGGARVEAVRHGVDLFAAADAYQDSLVITIIIAVLMKRVGSDTRQSRRRQRHTGGGANGSAQSAAR